MAHILAFIVVALIKIVNWVLIKSRLFMVAIPMAIIMIFFNEWCDKNELVISIIGLLLFIVIVISWIITAYNYVKTVRNNKMMLLEWAYEKYK